jgi:hypothetical protein
MLYPPVDLATMADMVDDYRGAGQVKFIMVSANISNLGMIFYALFHFRQRYLRLITAFSNNTQVMQVFQQALVFADRQDKF